MGTLPNIRHERFARAYHAKPVAAQAYLKAGYQPTTRNALDASASRVLRYAKVQARIRELQRQMAKRNDISLDTLLQDLADDRELARGLGQASAAIAATQLAAKLTGHLIDRKETGQPGEFSGLQTADDVLRALADQLGPDVAALLRARYDAQAAPLPAPAPAAVDLDAVPSEGNA